MTGGRSHRRFEPDSPVIVRALPHLGGGIGRSHRSIDSSPWHPSRRECAEECVGSSAQLLSARSWVHNAFPSRTREPTSSFRSTLREYWFHPHFHSCAVVSDAI